MIEWLDEWLDDEGDFTGFQCGLLTFVRDDKSGKFMAMRSGVDRFNINFHAVSVGKIRLRLLRNDLILPSVDLFVPSIAKPELVEALKKIGVEVYRE